MMCSVFLAISAASGHAHVNRSTLVFKLLPATDLFQASEAASACNFLGQPTLFMCQTSFVSARVNKSGPGIGSQ